MAASVAPLLRQVSFFADLDDASLELLAAHSRRRRFAAGEALFHEGDPGHTLYVILAGRVKIQTLTPAGDLIHLASRGSGETVGEMSLCDGKPRMADAVTAEPVDVLMLDRADFIRCLEEAPRMALGIIACLADRLREAADQLKRLQSQDVLGRVSTIILARVEQDGLEDGGDLPSIDKIGQQEIADEVGATRESVSRALSRLRQARVLSTEGRRWTVLDLRKLRQYCQQ